MLFLPGASAAFAVLENARPRVTGGQFLTLTEQKHEVFNSIELYMIINMLS